LARHQGIEWREADAASLPFGDSEFGTVICAFGIMFVPDRRAAFREMRRVLTKDGLLIFDVWDSIEHSAHHVACAKVFDETFPGDDQKRFTIPYEMYDVAMLRELLAEAHFDDVSIEKKRLALGRVSAETIATGQIRGTPRSLLIEQRGVSLDEMVRRVTSALTKLGGADPYVGTAQAITVTARAAG
jgi:SAM-dependent methyltransferase